MILDPEYQSLPVHPLSPPYGGAGIRPPKTGGHSSEAVEISHLACDGHSPRRERDGVRRWPQRRMHDDYFDSLVNRQLQQPGGRYLSIL